ncbi:CidA/LrgA family protein [Derxia lacustris]|uniref:CidA/LrgA family protein n=1 Tax=Derxia lacustris TaxID=764842 RepID=UPI000A176428|nr:CidA/LrgA family protein [Derxia lacustris]
MTIQRLPLRARALLRHSRLLQIGLLMSVWWLAESLRHWLGLPVPGSVLGLGAMLVLLLTRLVRVESFRQGARWLLGEMLLFFVPAAMALLDHPEFLSVTGLKLLAVVAVGTLLVMGTTALSVEACYLWTRRQAAR